MGHLRRIIRRALVLVKHLAGSGTRGQRILAPGLGTLFIRLRTAVDLGAVAVAYLLAWMSWTLLPASWWPPFLRETIPERNFLINGLVTAALLPFVFRALELHRDDQHLGRLRRSTQIVKGWIVLLVSTQGVVLWLESSLQSRGIFLIVWTLLLPLFLAGRLLVGRIASFLRRRGLVERRAVVFGTGEQARLLVRRLQETPELGIEPAVFLDENSSTWGSVVEGLPVLGGGDELSAAVHKARADLLLVAQPRAGRKGVVQILLQARALDLEVRLLPSLFDLVFEEVDLFDVEGIPLAGVSVPGIPPSRQTVKRGMDLFVGGLLAILTTPVILAVHLWLCRRHGTSGLVQQARVGRNGWVFDAWFLQLPHCPLRHGPLVRYLFLSRLAELPQLWNVVLGDMSLVGPRPEKPSRLQTYDVLRKQRLNVLPGITGAWQLNPWREKADEDGIDIDILYLRQHSIILDLEILVRTVPLSLAGRVRPPLHYAAIAEPTDS